MLLDFYEENVYDLAKEKIHHYISGAYSKCLAEYPIYSSLLEVGVYEGASIEFWSDYFEEGMVTGLDINTDVCLIPLEGDNYVILQCDAYTHEAINSLKFKYDIIIEDGSHELDHQLFFMEHYFSLLNPGGILVVEDLIIEHVEIIKEKFPDCELYDLRALGRGDSMILTRKNEIN